MGALYSRVVFQPPRPPRYSRHSFPHLTWVHTKQGSRVPVIYYDEGLAAPLPPSRRRRGRPPKHATAEHQSSSSWCCCGGRTPAAEVGGVAQADAAELDALEQRHVRQRERQRRQRRASQGGAASATATPGLTDDEVGMDGVERASVVGNGMSKLSTREASTFPSVQRPFAMPEQHMTILYSHGNAEDLASAGVYLSAVTMALGCRALAYDYTGYGLSLPADAQPCERHFYQDIDAAYRCLLRSGVPPERIILVGRSIGTAPTIDLASRERVGGVVLIAPLTSCLRVVKPNMRCTLPFADMFPSINKVQHIGAPVLIIHGMQDEVVPFCHGLQLYGRCAHAVDPLWLDKAGHNDIELHHFHQVIERFRRFFRHCAAFFPERETSRVSTRASCSERFALSPRTLMRRLSVLPS